MSFDTSMVPEESGEYMITPALAEAWLTTNVTNNRIVSKAKVRKIANLMLNGGFRKTHQGLAFNVNGELFDGQHRLRAIVMSGIPQMMRVTVGEPVDNFLYVDVEGGRKTADFISGPNRGIRSSAARILWQADNDRFSSALVVPLHILRPYEELWEPELETYSVIARRISRESVNVSPSPLLAVFVQCSEQYNVHSLSLPGFMNAFSNGTGQSTPVGSFLKKAAMYQGRWRGGSTQHIPYRYLVLAWNAWVLDKDSVRLPNNPAGYAPIPMVLGRKRGTMGDE